MRGKRLLIVAAVFVTALLCVRVEHVKFQWGGFWSVDFVAPWQR